MQTTALANLLHPDAEHAGRAGLAASLAFTHRNFQESDMGKYFLGWILGVPAVVLVGIYVVSHLL